MSKYTADPMNYNMMREQMLDHLIQFTAMQTASEDRKDKQISVAQELENSLKILLLLRESERTKIKVSEAVAEHILFAKDLMGYKERHGEDDYFKRGYNVWQSQLGKIIYSAGYTDAEKIRLAFGTEWVALAKTKKIQEKENIATTFELG